MGKKFSLHFIFIHKCVNILSICFKHNLKQGKHTIIGLITYQEYMQYPPYSFFFLALSRYNCYIQNCTHLTYTSCWVWTYAYTHDITTTRVLNISITSKNVLVFFLFVGALNMRFILLMYFKVHSLLLLTTGTMLYSRSLELIYLV